MPSTSGAGSSVAPISFRSRCEGTAARPESGPGRTRVQAPSSCRDVPHDHGLSSCFVRPVGSASARPPHRGTAAPSAKAARRELTRIGGPDPGPTRALRRTRPRRRTLLESRDPPPRTRAGTALPGGVRTFPRKRSIERVGAVRPFRARARPTSCGPRTITSHRASGRGVRGAPGDWSGSCGRLPDPCTGDPLDPARRPDAAPHPSDRPDLVASRRGRSGGRRSPPPG